MQHVIDQAKNVDSEVYLSFNSSSYTRILLYFCVSNMVWTRVGISVLADICKKNISVSVMVLVSPYNGRHAIFVKSLISVDISKNIQLMVSTVDNKFADRLVLPFIFISSHSTGDILPSKYLSMASVRSLAFGPESSFLLTSSDFWKWKLDSYFLNSDLRVLDQCTRDPYSLGSSLFSQTPLLVKKIAPTCSIPMQNEIDHY